MIIEYFRKVQYIQYISIIFNKSILTILNARFKLAPPQVYSGSAQKPLNGDCDNFTTCTASYQ